MNSNQQSLAYFSIAETIRCFMKLNQPKTQNSLEKTEENHKNQENETFQLIEEADIVNHILQEMVNQNIAEATDSSKLALDYSQFYQIIDIMCILGLIVRKNDTTCPSSKYL